MKKNLLYTLLAVGILLIPTPQQKLRADAATYVVKIIKKTISTANTCVEKAFTLTWEYKYHLCLLALTVYTYYLAHECNCEARAMLELIKEHKNTIIQKIYYVIFQENEHSLNTIFNRIRDFIFATFLIKAKDKVSAEINALEMRTNLSDSQDKRTTNPT